MNKIQDYLEYLNEDIIGKTGSAIVKIVKKPKSVQNFIRYSRRLNKIRKLNDKIQDDKNKLKVAKTPEEAMKIKNRMKETNKKIKKMKENNK